MQSQMVSKCFPLKQLVAILVKFIPELVIDFLNKALQWTKSEKNRFFRKRDEKNL